MAKKPAAREKDAAGAALAADSSQAEFLVLALMSAIVPMIEAKCGTLGKRDVSTLKRQVEKAVREFIKGAQK